MIRRVCAAATVLVAAFFMPTAAFAQGAVQQSGAVVPGHTSVWRGNGIIGDGGVPFVPPLVFVADNYSGSSLPIKIAAAFAACGAARCEVIVNGTGGSTINTRVSVPAHDVLHFQPGSWTIVGGGFETGQGAAVEGAGRDVSLFTVYASPFDGKGVFLLDGGGSTAFTFASDNAGTVRNLKVTFSQPDTTSRGALTTYNPAIDVRQFRAIIHDVAITQATTGIDLSGMGTATTLANGGGADIDHVEMSAYTIGLLADGVTDTTHYSNAHFWPFDMTNNQYAIFQTPGTTGIQCGRADQLMVVNFTSLGNLGINAYQGAITGLVGDCSLNLSNSDLENNGIVASAGFIQVASTNFQNGMVGAKWINNSGAAIKVAAAWFNESAMSPGCGPCVLNTGGSIQIVGSKFQSGGNSVLVDETFVEIDQGTAIISDNFFDRLSFTPGTPNTPATLTHPTILQTAGRITARGNRASDIFAGSTGMMIKVTTDDWNWIDGTMPVGWSTSFPANPSLGTYYPNGAACQGTSALNSSGDAVLSMPCITAHSISLCSDASSGGSGFPISCLATAGTLTVNGVASHSFAWIIVNPGQ